MRRWERFLTAIIMQDIHYNRQNSLILVILNFSSFILEYLQQWKIQVSMIRVICTIESNGL